MKKIKKSRENKKLSLILIRVLLFFVPLFLTLFIIGCHSSYLIKTYIKWTLLIFLIISFALLIFSMLIYYKNRNTGHIHERKHFKLIYSLILGVYIIGIII